MVGKPFSAALVVVLMLWQQQPAAAEMGPEEGPTVDPQCHARTPFCARGRPAGGLPTLRPEDGVIVFLQRRVGLGEHPAVLTELKTHFPRLLGLGSDYREAIVFYSYFMKRNFTLSWDPLFGVDSGVSPVFQNTTQPIWCNVGAPCCAETKSFWAKAESVLKVAEMTGENFNQLAAWVDQQNRTLTPFDIWTVYNSSNPNMTVSFDARDSNSYTQSVVAHLASIGVDFFDSVTPVRSRVALYSDVATYLGNSSDIFGPTSKQQALAEEMGNFFNCFRPGQSMLEKWRSLFKLFWYIVIRKRFFIYREGAYWQLRMTDPYISVQDEPWSLPKTANDLDFPFLL